MDDQVLKEFTRLNLQYTGLRLAEEDSAEAKKHVGIIQKVINANINYDAFHYEVKENRFERFWFSSMSLTCWAVACFALLLFPLISYYRNGTITTVHEYAWLFYILPAIVLAIRFFVGSFINIAHGILLLICAGLTAFNIRIFGNEINWIWIFIFVGTLLTIGGRLWEASHDIKKNKQWYREQAKVLSDANTAMPKAISSYTFIGSRAKAEMSRLAPNADIIIRTPWFMPPVGKRGKEKQLQLLAPQNAQSDFVIPKQDRNEPFYEYDTVYEHRKEGTHTITVYDQELGNCVIPSERAITYIQEGTLIPFFGMGVPEHTKDLIYTLWHHRWSEHIHTEGIETTVTKIKEWTGAKKKAENQFDDYERKVYGTSAWAATMVTTAGEVRRQEYLDKKKKVLDSLSDEQVTERIIETFQIDKVSEMHYEELGALTVSTPDGTVVGLYCTSTDQSISCARNLAFQYWGAELSAWVIPNGEAQRSYLYRNCFM